MRRSPCLQEILPCRICKAGQLFFRNRICYIQSSLQNGLIDHRKLEIQFGIFIWHGDRVRETVRLEGDRFSIAGNRAEYTVHRREVQLQRFVRHHLCAVNAVPIHNDAFDIALHFQVRVLIPLDKEEVGGWLLLRLHNYSCLRLQIFRVLYAFRKRQDARNRIGARLRLIAVLFPGDRRIRR